MPIKKTDYATAADEVMAEIEAALRGDILPHDGDGAEINNAVDLGSEVSPFASIFVEGLAGFTSETAALIELASRSALVFNEAGTHTIQWPFADASSAVVFLWSGDGLAFADFLPSAVLSATPLGSADFSLIYNPDQHLDIWPLNLLVFNLGTQPRNIFMAVILE